MLDKLMLIHMPLMPKRFMNSNANGILSAVNTMLIPEGILGIAIPVNNPFDIISTALKTCEKATTFKYDTAIEIVVSSFTNNLIMGLLKRRNTPVINTE